MNKPFSQPLRGIRGKSTTSVVDFFFNMHQIGGEIA